MTKTVTFSVSTMNLKETIALKELGIDEKRSEIEIKQAVDAYFKEWVWNKVSFSYVIEEE
ncbi:hypothetical protein BC6307_07980 [Sutcliffiella cohnii]|uniref:Uncharacterized protein n=1 Tax=Sutcliffiella cohnii TaxID=33932 RepID=A0A223KP06_9BACI|nr:hypothetical protein [Sutcliffiella cohnii]AST91221.1 hypothetical protein BC6307_07980 [Sutcliffiella cohnii]